MNKTIIKKYLIHTGPGIGDMMQFFSMARAIKEQYPNSRVDFIMRGTPSFYKIDSELLKFQHYTDHLYWYSFKSPIQNLKLLWQFIKIGRYDYGFVRVGSITGWKSLWIYRLMRLFRCKTIIGTGYDRVDILIENSERIHYLQRNAQMLEAVGITPRIDAVSIFKKDLDIDWLETLSIPMKTPVIGLSLGCNTMIWKEGNNIIEYDVKSWAIERWIQLAVDLSQNNYFVVLLGGSQELNILRVKGIKIPERSNLLNFVGRLPLKRTLTIIGRCLLMVGAEGGLMHSASAIGVKTLTIFGGTDAHIWNPGGVDSPTINLNCSCAPCFGTKQAAECKYHKCLENISVDIVRNRVISLIEGNERPIK